MEFVRARQLPQRLLLFKVRYANDTRDLAVFRLLSVETVRVNLLDFCNTTNNGEIRRLFVTRSRRFFTLLAQSLRLGISQSFCQVQKDLVVLMAGGVNGDRTGRIHCWEELRTS